MSKKKEKHLDKVLASQRFKEGDDELKDLRSHREDVEKLINDAFGNKPKIRYGGSKAKGTMIKASYDLDLICYFASGDESGGKTLKDIYKNVKAALEESYTVEEKRSALRLRSTDDDIDFHIDVVPGRFTDDDEQDAYLFQAEGEKNRLKTNLDTHIKHVRNSGHADVIAILKLMVVNYNLTKVKTFVLELAAIDVLDGADTSDLTERVELVLTAFRDDIGNITVKDPANPEGNDLSGIWSDQAKTELEETATHVLEVVEDDGWESVFALEEDEAAEADVKEAAAKVKGGSKPWARTP